MAQIRVAMVNPSLKVTGPSLLSFAAATCGASGVRFSVGGCRKYTSSGVATPATNAGRKEPCEPAGEGFYLFFIFIYFLFYFFFRRSATTKYDGDTVLEHSHASARERERDTTS